MTAPATTRRAGPFNGNGVSTSFPFTFKVFSKTDVQVQRTTASGVTTTLVQDSDYSVTVNADQDASPGGTITYPISGTPLATGEKLVALGATAYDQPTDLPEGGAYRAKVVEDALDRTEFQIQQVVEELSRSLTLPATAATADTTLPVPQANKLISWNSNADGLTNRDVTEVVTTAAYSNWQTQRFSGTGAQTVFVLESDPGSVHNMDVSIGGATQANDVDFTLRGLQVTFTSAPAAGTNNILIRHGQALPQSVTQASAVNFTAAGSGASTRDSQSKMREQVSILDFGGDSTGVTASDTALANAIAALGTNGGDVLLPATASGNTYVFANPISLAEKYGITLRGHGKSVTVHNQGTVLKYTGTGVRFIDLRSSHDCGLRGLRITYSNASFTGYLLDLSNSTGSDCSGFEADYCHFGAYDGLLHNGYGVNADKAIIAAFTRCSFDSLNAAVDGQASGGGSYSNVIQFINCTFGDTALVPVRYCGESWTFDRCTFEPRQGGLAGGILTTASTPVKAFTFTGNWLGDVSSGGSTWVILYGKGATLTGNRFGGTASGAAVSLNAFSGFTSSGNSFVLFGTVYSFDTTGCTGFVEYSNDYDTCTNVYGTTANQTSFTNGTTGYTILPNGMLLQWGRSTVTAGTPLAVTFAKAYTNANYGFNATLYSPASGGNTVYASGIGTSGITLNVNGSGANTVHWQVVGQA